MAGLQEQIDAILRQMAINREDIDSLERRAEVAEMRADAADLRTDAVEGSLLEDRDMLAELHQDGVLSQEHARQMEEALKSSRTVGAAVGIIMSSRGLSESEAFNVLRTASEKSNRKLRELAAELVDSIPGDDTPVAARG